MGSGFEKEKKTLGEGRARGREVSKKKEVLSWGGGGGRGGRGCGSINLRQRHTSEVQCFLGTSIFVWGVPVGLF